MRVFEKGTFWQLHAHRETVLPDSDVHVNIYFCVALDSPDDMLHSGCLSTAPVGLYFLSLTIRAPGRAVETRTSSSDPLLF